MACHSQKRKLRTNRSTGPTAIENTNYTTLFETPHQALSLVAAALEGSGQGGQAAQHTSNAKVEQAAVAPRA